MEYQKIISLLGYAPNQPSKNRTKNWVEVNDDLRGIYNTNGQIKLKTSMLKSRLFDYSDAYIAIKGNITFLNIATAAAQNDGNEEVVLCSIHWLHKWNKQIDNRKDIYVSMNMYSLIEYSENYLHTSGSLWQ